MNFKSKILNHKFKSLNPKSKSKKLNFNPINGQKLLGKNIIVSGTHHFLLYRTKTSHSI